MPESITATPTPAPVAPNAWRAASAPMVSEVRTSAVGAIDQIAIELGMLRLLTGNTGFHLARLTRMLPVAVLAGGKCLRSESEDQEQENGERSFGTPNGLSPGIVRGG